MSGGGGLVDAEVEGVEGGGDAGGLDGVVRVGVVFAGGAAEVGDAADDEGDGGVAGADELDDGFDVGGDRVDPWGGGFAVVEVFVFDADVVAAEPDDDASGFGAELGIEIVGDGGGVGEGAGPVGGEGAWDGPVEGVAGESGVGEGAEAAHVKVVVAAVVEDFAPIADVGCVWGAADAEEGDLVFFGETVAEDDELAGEGVGGGEEGGGEERGAEEETGGGHGRGDGLPGWSEGGVCQAKNFW